MQPSVPSGPTMHCFSTSCAGSSACPRPSQHMGPAAVTGSSAPLPTTSRTAPPPPAALISTNTTASCSRPSRAATRLPRAPCSARPKPSAAPWCAARPAGRRRCWLPRAKPKRTPATFPPRKVGRLSSSSVTLASASISMPTSQEQGNITRNSRIAKASASTSPISTNRRFASACAQSGPTRIPSIRPAGVSASPATSRRCSPGWRSNWKRKRTHRSTSQPS